MRYAETVCPKIDANGFVYCSERNSRIRQSKRSDSTSMGTVNSSSEEQISREQCTIFVGDSSCSSESNE